MAQKTLGEELIQAVQDAIQKKGKGSKKKDSLSIKINKFLLKA